MKRIFFLLGSFGLALFFGKDLVSSDNSSLPTTLPSWVYHSHIVQKVVNLQGLSDKNPREVCFALDNHEGLSQVPADTCVHVRENCFVKSAEYGWQQLRDYLQYSQPNE